MPKIGDSNPYESPSMVGRSARETPSTVAAFALAILALAWIGGYIVQTGGSQIGLFEIVLLLFVTACVTVGSATSKRHWLFGLPAFFAIAVVCSPADPMSTLAIAVPSCCVYAIALLRTTRQPASL